MRLWTGSDWAPVPGPRPRTLLALLLIGTGRYVSIEHMVAELWPADPPTTAATLIRGYILQLRRALGDLTGETILTRASGYELRCPTDMTDVARFDTLTAQGRAALAKGAAEEAYLLLTQALALWRGEPYSDALLTTTVTAEVSRLDERRLTAAEARIEAGLLQGRGPELIHELQGLTGEHPLREGLWAQLIRALHAADRRADALDAYRRARQSLVEELGLEPGPDLRELHQAILEGRSLADRAGPAPSGPEDAGRGGVHSGRPAEESPAASMPRPLEPPLELPRDIPAFTGRQQDLSSLQRLMTDPGGSGAVVITGGGGMGKSALAVHLAHRLRDHFPGGQLYVDLQGSREDLKPLHPAEALGRMLRSLGVAPMDVPPDTAEAAARFRSLTTGRGILVVLDNAVDTSQVEPLLPGERSGVLVTGRRPLTTLGCAVHHLGPLSEQESVAMLAALAGQDRVTAEPEAALRITHYCESLPLALRIAAARLTSRPHWPLWWLADKLESEHHRLGELAVGDMSLRSAFTVSFRDLESEPSGQDLPPLLRLLAISGHHDITAHLTAALAGIDIDQAERLLEKLLDTRLLDSPEPGRYRMSDLMRLVVTIGTEVHDGRCATSGVAEPSLHGIESGYQIA
ncbi:AfsR/SARP family transcriptional regulator [Sphaerisporangium fuscum]|uniref:AfsR/SARP family transcriptional regulator n=1 Tax=Sphaerisporangium fuscum TaxID=2835868 RepID=UPI001BDCE2D2|nr:BTAD domain-containing putative transcriptional regulator [Sphaerisporangium fuscum]